MKEPEGPMSDQHAPAEKPHTQLVTSGFVIAILAYLLPALAFVSFVLGIVATVKGRVGAGVWIMILSVVMFGYAISSRLPA